MRIMLVCMAGFTTNVLANKLQIYSKEKGYGDTFIACRISNAMEFLKGNDCILIAPQARTCCHELREEAKRLGIVQMDISEEDMAFSRIEKIYEQINTYRITVQEENTRKVLTFSIVCDVLRDTVIYCVPLFLLAVFSFFMYEFFECEAARCLWLVSGRTFGFYLIFALGYQYGTAMNRDRLASGLITLSSVLILMPVTDLESKWLGSFYVVEGMIPLSFVSLPHSVLLLIPAILALICQDIFQKLPLEKLLQTSGGYAGIWGEYIVRGGCVFASFTILRVLLWSVASVF